ncbi:MAG: hypothetical protein JNK72_02110 [Myxococcales bacterium]|nr:hypothetical protein [Myxococcales bacterium]
MGAELTVRQKILVAAAALSTDAENFTAEELIVRAWELFPESFSLRGYHAKYPDSNRVLAKLSGSDGLCGLGWLEHTDQRTYACTKKGRLVARQLAALQSAVGVDLGASEPVEAPARVEARPAVSAPAAPAKAPARPRPARVERAAPTPRAEEKPAPRPTVVLSSLSNTEVAALQQVARAEALRKFLRGSPLSFNDASAFWGIIGPMRAGMAQQRIELTGDLLKRAVESFSDEGSDPRLPSLSTCYGLFNLHRLMLDKFAREVDALRLPAVG